ncbi:MAG: T9SS type A sorting domain-containing protein, partial [Bacteroidia bacterium]
GIRGRANQNLLIYPNPAKTAVRLQFSEEIRGAEIQFIDAYGRITKSISGVNGLFLDADISDFADGLYTVVCFANGNRFAKKIQKQ